LDAVYPRNLESFARCFTLGVPREHAEAAINHISGRSALERTYDRHDYADEVIVALSTWQAHVAEIVRPDAGAPR
jgi:hypothetical protein